MRKEFNYLLLVLLYLFRRNLPHFEFELPKECRRPQVLRESIPHCGRYVPKERKL